MRDVLERTVLTVRRDGDAWAVEHEGGLYGHSPDKEVAKAWAHKQARALMDKGAAVKVMVQGEWATR